VDRRWLTAGRGRGKTEIGPPARPEARRRRQRPTAGAISRRCSAAIDGRGGRCAHDLPRRHIGRRAKKGREPARRRAGQVTGFLLPISTSHQAENASPSRWSSSRVSPEVSLLVRGAGRQYAGARARRRGMWRTAPRKRPLSGQYTMQGRPSAAPRGVVERVRGIFSSNRCRSSPGTCTRFAKGPCGRPRGRKEETSMQRFLAD